MNLFDKLPYFQVFICSSKSIEMAHKATGITFFLSTFLRLDAVFSDNIARFA